MSGFVGQSAETLATATTHVAGVDLGGTKTRIGIATADAVLVAETVEPTGRDAGRLPIQIAARIRALAAVAGVDPAAIGATGVGAAGVPDAAGSFAIAPNLGGIGETPFARELAANLGHRVVLENDVNVAALGELRFGVGRNCRDFVVVAVGTGIGMGIVSDGRLLRGARGAAGEIGFLPLGTDPFDARNHRRGPLEETVAGDVLAARYQEAGGGEVTARQVFELAAAGDHRAQEAIDAEARWLSAGIVAVAAILDPDLVVLGGGIGGRRELADRVRAWLPRYGVAGLDVRISELGDRAPVLGAVGLAIDALGARKDAS